MREIKAGRLLMGIMELLVGILLLLNPVEFISGRNRKQLHRKKVLQRDFFILAAAVFVCFIPDGFWQLFH